MRPSTTVLAPPAQNELVFISENSWPAVESAEQHPPAPLSRACKEELIEPSLHDIPQPPYSKDPPSMVDQTQTSEQAYESTCGEMDIDLPAQPTSLANVAQADGAVEDPMLFPTSSTTRPALAPISTQATAPLSQSPAIFDLADQLRRIIGKMPGPQPVPRTFAELGRWCGEKRTTLSPATGVVDVSEWRGRPVTIAR
ncbi:hypothetical protein C8Q80DRAFT_320657 [Daedaleopsis nitida]|nr:hypothetical protein C8Q80DRAFT_320657 [Daedaleopsis nitida]